jgi:hypothetical protein
MGSNKHFVAQRKDANLQHGHKRRNGASAEYKTWLGMKRRCYATKCKDYPNWGGRGITVCDRWLRSFSVFLADMGPKPSAEHSIDRLDPGGNYEPANCRWATPTAQGAENKRSNIEVVVDGVVFKTMAAACRHFGVSQSKAHGRISAGIDPAVAVSCVDRLRPRRK